MAKYLDDNGLAYFWSKIVAKFYQKPNTGIPKNDLASAVQTSLGLADSALQEIDSSDVVGALGYTPYNATNPSGYQNSAEVQQAINTAISGIDFGSKIVSTDASNTPAGVTWTKTEGGQTVTITGTLPASPQVAKNMYLVPNSGSGVDSYDEYIVASVGGSYVWNRIGSTQTDLTGYWSKAELTNISNSEIDDIVTEE